LGEVIVPDVPPVWPPQAEKQMLVNYKRFFAMLTTAHNTNIVIGITKQLFCFVFVQ